MKFVLSLDVPLALSISFYFSEPQAIRERVLREHMPKLKII